MQGQQAMRPIGVELQESPICFNPLDARLNFGNLIYLFIIGFIYRPHMLTPQSGGQVRESGA